MFLFLLVLQSLPFVLTGALNCQPDTSHAHPDLWLQTRDHPETAIQGKHNLQGKPTVHYGVIHNICMSMSSSERNLKCV